MRSFANFLFLKSGPVGAQISPSERVEDCLEIRAPALAYERWLNAPCARTKDCPNFEDYYDAGDRFLGCFSEAYLVCEASNTTEPSAGQTCTDEVDALLSARVSHIDVESLAHRLQVLAQTASGLRKHSIERRLSDLQAGSRVDCKQFEHHNVFNLQMGVFCERIRRLFRAATVVRVSDFVSRQAILE